MTNNKVNMLEYLQSFYLSVPSFFLLSQRGYCVILHNFVTVFMSESCEVTASQLFFHSENVAKDQVFFS